ncbi:MAG: ABC transporter ATP-binding protein [Candidatus Saccharimonadales bacterium]
MSNLLRLLKLFTPYLLWLVLLVLFVWGQATVNLTLPDFTSKIVNEGILLNDLDSIWSNGLLMLLITSLGGLCAIGVGFLASKISAGYVRRLREKVFEKIESFSLGEFDQFSTSSLVTRSTNDMQQVQTVMSMFLRIAFLAPFMGIGSIIKAYNINVAMSQIVFVTVGIITILVVILFIVVVPKFTMIQKNVDKLSQQMREMLTGVRVVRAYNNDKMHQDKFDITNKTSVSLNIFVNRVVMMMQPVMTLIMGLTSMAVVWVGAYKIEDRSLMVGDLLALMQYVMQTVMAFLMISAIFILIPRLAVSLKRIGEILSTKPKIVDPSNLDSKKAKHLARASVVFKNVSFGYNDSEQPILSDISFEAKFGEMTAIIGGTGSGKSSILKLITRLYDVTGGSILIGNQDIRDMSQKQLRDLIGYVPQKASLFTGTIKSNLLYGNRTASDKDITDAIKLAQAKEFIDKLPDGINSTVSQAGGNFSGGQKQRLSIARALIKKPSIYLFDDSFSALDYKTDAKLRKALKGNIKNSVFLIVAQRVSTIMKAAKIIVLDDGKIAGIGTHKELLKNCSVYKEIAESQLSQAELGVEL